MNLKDVNLYENYKNWRNFSNFFEPYVKSTSFVSLQQYNDFLLEELCFNEKELYLFEKIKVSLKSCQLTKTLLLIDLPGELSVKIGFLLYRDLNIKPVLSINAILHPFGFCGNRTYISNLLNCGISLPDVTPLGYSFIFDYNRFVQSYTNFEETTFNNQYEVTEEDLPSCELLKNLNYTSVLYFSLDKVKEDMDSYIGYLKNNNFNITVIKIGDMD